eukprot:gene11981-12125_t
MEKEVIKWLHTQMGYNASADSSLSANCRGNLKTLWEFLMTRHMAPENKRRIQQVLVKHRREQEAARRAPEREQEALQQKRHLQQLEQTAATMHRTLASLQVVLLQAYMQRNHRLLQVLQEKLLGLHSILDVAQARCQAEVVVVVVISCNGSAMVRRSAATLHFAAVYDVRMEYAA